MANPPRLYIPVPTPVVDQERHITRDWVLVFDQLIARTFASGTVVGPSTSVDNAITLFSGTSGQILKAATGTGVVHATSGVYSAADVVLTSEVSGVLPIANGGGLSGTYTPTLTAVTNVSASTAYVCQWLQVGTTVTVSGRVDVDPTAAGLTQLGLSLPVASTLAAAEQCAGVAAAPGIAGQSAALLGDVTNARAQLEWIAVDVTNQPWYFTFTYQLV